MPDPMSLRDVELARFPQHGSSAQSLLQAAASALHEATHGLRDRVAVAPAI